MEYVTDNFRRFFKNLNPGSQTESAAAAEYDAIKTLLESAGGDAALLKYARSIFMKTLEALVVEFEAAIATLPGRDIVTASIERNLGPTLIELVLW